VEFAKAIANNFGDGRIARQLLGQLEIVLERVLPENLVARQPKVTPVDPKEKIEYKELQERAGTRAANCLLVFGGVKTYEDILKIHEVKRFAGTSGLLRLRGMGNETYGRLVAYLAEKRIQLEPASASE
jgi:hypothetical protein